MAERTQQLTDVRRLTSQDVEAVRTFLGSLPEGDLTFMKEDIELDAIRMMCDEGATRPRWIVVGEDGVPQAMLTIVPGALWSSHVGELRLVVGRDFRRRGLGRRLARHGLAEAVRLGLRKVVVEVVADKEGDIAMFTSIGFDAEALLRDHICDRDGELHDLVLLAHEVGANSATMDVLGLGGEVGLGGSV